MASKEISNDLTIFGSDKKKEAEFHHSTGKGHVWKESGAYDEGEEWRGTRHSFAIIRMMLLQ